ncbi:MAG: metal-sulfur cluster assembly factor [Candidatus Marinimicrobia bacterium]|jgi:metal-sulfur cluster biosynthetic enzyme|nr:metal-sulfur cluster assembly factor [Candidatus Neomarinimicrobiota bacterium]MBT4361503.1 metal-sulfur cluster assembly factor [Candidatus Neomarinimicrobiota bacterium]MBT4713941.1 metal-sulfur cluster assembly factor [Candidatus Neomarinimicrobiota bacterium]MBT4946460.1 metal-sulfur cluster assembly factor [Candidatus Neomarinimicrobiota bacterium]MBT5269548.1 metal-sulfur cluster assembly factor [Candidatus Neomarinimicrobiota bacterium]
MKTRDEIKEIESELEQILYGVMDPEVELNIVDLGLIYSLIYDGQSQVEIKMTFSTPACPLGDAILMNIRQSITNVYPEFEVDIEVVFEPAWNADMISEKGRLMLGM